MLLKHDYRCAHCGRQEQPENLEKEHEIPYAIGGAHSASNIVPACRACNARREL